MTDFTKDKMPCLKALFALLIVADHLTFHVDAGWLRPFRELGAPIVSCFLFMSGYGLVKSFSSKGPGYLNGFFRKRVWKVILPSLIALIFFWILNWQPRNYLEDVRLLFTNGIPLLPYSWFVEVIVLMYVGFWLCWKFLPEHFRLPGIWIWAVLIILSTIFLSYDRCWWVGNLAFPTGATFAALETDLHRTVLKNKLRAFAGIVVLTVLTLALMMTGNQYCFIFCYISIPLIVAVLTCLLPLDKMNNRVIAFFAGISYEIYLCQGISMEFLRGGLVNVKHDIVYIVFVYVMTIALAWCVKKLSEIRLCRPLS